MSWPILCRSMQLSCCCWRTLVPFLCTLSSHFCLFPTWSSHVIAHECYEGQAAVQLQDWRPLVPVVIDCFIVFEWFLADLTNSLRLCYSVVSVCLSVCPLSVTYLVHTVAKPCVLLPKNCVKKQIGNGLWRIEWSRDGWRHVTPKGQVVIPIRLWP